MLVLVVNTDNMKQNADKRMKLSVSICKVSKTSKLGIDVVLEHVQGNNTGMT